MRWGSHIAGKYSRTEQTSEKYAVSLSFAGHKRRFCHRNPRLELALLAVLVICYNQLCPLLMVTPRYLAVLTCSSACPPMEYNKVLTGTHGHYEPTLSPWDSERSQGRGGQRVNYSWRQDLHSGFQLRRSIFYPCYFDILSYSYSIKYGNNMERYWLCLWELFMSLHL